MTFKTIPTLSAALAVIVLAGVPTLAQQSMFQQMPTLPDETPPAGAAPAAPAVPASPPIAAPTVSLGAPPPSVAPAQSIGQQADCGAIQKTLEERKALVMKANTASKAKQKMTPQQACALFGQLQENGNRGIKWITANKEWCSIPDSFSEGFKNDNAKVAGIRTKICGMAAQATKMEAQARENGGGAGGLLGGPGLSGSFKMPQGAL